MRYALLDPSAKQVLTKLPGDLCSAVDPPEAFGEKTTDGESMMTNQHF